jgi:glycolate oxidase iron-sulfur subunit
LAARATRLLLTEAVPRRWIFAPSVRVGRLLRACLPAKLAEKVPDIVTAKPWPRPAAHRRRMIVLAGCVQSTLTPNTNAAAARVLDRLGIALFEAPGAGCCGAMRHHLHAKAPALDDIRRVIDAWWPHLENGVEGVVMTASGCGAHVRDYGVLLRHDPAYAEKAARIAAMTRDVSEVLASEQEALSRLLRESGTDRAGRRVAFHSPCTLQHWQQIRGVVEGLLAAAGYRIVPIADAHLCCGSAGSYSISQPLLARQLRDNKLAAMTASAPDVLVTANVGCQTHLQSGGTTPVRHWIELIDERLNGVC